MTQYHPNSKNDHSMTQYHPNSKKDHSVTQYHPSCKNDHSMAQYHHQYLTLQVQVKGLEDQVYMFCILLLMLVDTCYLIPPTNT